MQNSEYSAPMPQPGRPIILGGAVYLLLVALGVAFGGEVAQIALAGLNALPFAVLAVLAYLAGSRFNWAWVVGILWLTVLMGGATLLAFAATSAVFFDMQNPDMNRLPPDGLLSIGLVFGGSLFAGMLGLLCLVPAVRRVLARFIPIDPTSFVHALALACVVSLSIICALPLLIIGEPPLLAALAQTIEASGDISGGRDGAGQLRDQLYSLIWTIPAAALAVGFGISRNLPTALERLGLVRPTWRQVLAGVGIALLLAGAMSLIGNGIDWLWKALGWATTDQEAFAELLSFALNPVGALVIGVTAGLGEELAVRGVLQPRMGLILSNLFFTSLHALQYNWDALLVVFLVGMICGVVRNRTNTTTAAIVHGVYNATLIMLAVWFGV